MAIKDLENLPLSHLFSGPLIAAIDASIQVQSEKVDLLLDAGFDEKGDLITVSFGYTTSEIDAETGEEGRVKKEINVPILMFLSLPNLVVSQVEEEFSVRIKEVEKVKGSSTPGRVSSPFRLRVKPSGKAKTFNREIDSTYDLNIRMLAELENGTSGMEALERAVSGAITENIKEK